MIEEWKDVIGFEGYYQISNLGNIKSLDRDVWNRFSNVFRQGRILKENIDKYGYKYINLKHNSLNKTLKTHRLVAIHFIDNPLDLKQVNHIDGDKTNNNSNNLEWCTSSENIRHAYKIGLMNGNAIGIKVAQINIQTNEIVYIFHSLQEAARKLSADASNIRKVCVGKIKHIKGFKWTFATETMKVGDIFNDTIIDS